ncbi:hypothetical protein [Streptomyces sp. NPDC102437]|uniref:hypothetical protein n=1 Tax=Streptomyces sp. NPDC102437 TaxID=3366175 RepID=UPI00380442E2
MVGYPGQLQEKGQLPAGQPLTDRDLIAERPGIIIDTTGCTSGEIQARPRLDQYEAARKAAAAHQEMFGHENYGLELMVHCLDTERDVRDALLRLARDLHIPLLATNDAHSPPRSRPMPTTACSKKVRCLLHEGEELQTHAEQLAMGEEVEPRVGLEALCPLPPVLEMRRGFFAGCPQRRLPLQLETVTGPCERRLEDDAALIDHRPQSDVRMEWIDLGLVALVPVVTPGSRTFPPDTDITPQRMQASLSAWSEKQLTRP